MTAQIFCGSAMVSQVGLPSPTLYATTSLYAAFTAVLEVIHMPGASAPEAGASGASLYQSTFASPALRSALKSSVSSPPSPLPSPGLTGAPLDVALPSSLGPATGFLPPSSSPFVTANTVPPITSSAATAAPTTSAGRPLKGLRPPGGVPGAPGAPGNWGGCG